MMLQQNSFFSTPFIFFGSHSEPQEEELALDEEESNLYISLNPLRTPSSIPQTGLFLLWSTDLPEE